MPNTNLWTAANECCATKSWIKIHLCLCFQIGFAQEFLFFILICFPKVFLKLSLLGKSMVQTHKYNFKQNFLRGHIPFYWFQWLVTIPVSGNMSKKMIVVHCFIRPLITEGCFVSKQVQGTVCNYERYHGNSGTEAKSFVSVTEQERLLSSKGNFRFLTPEINNLCFEMIVKIGRRGCFI